MEAVITHSLLEGLTFEKIFYLFQEKEEYYELADSPEFVPKSF